MNELSPIADAIRRYKLNADGGYEEWSKVPCTHAYRMHVPSQGFDVQGAAEGLCPVKWCNSGPPSEPKLPCVQ